MFVVTSRFLKRTQIVVGLFSVSAGIGKCFFFCNCSSFPNKNERRHSAVLLKICTTIIRDLLIIVLIIFTLS